MQNNFGRYLDLAGREEIVVTKNGAPIARLIGVKAAVSFLSERLVGLAADDADEESLKTERLKRQ